MSSIALAVECDSVSFISPDSVKTGQWFWTDDIERNWRTGEDIKTTWLGCVISIGTNYVELHAPRYRMKNGSSQRKKRVHIDNLHKELRQENNASLVISNNITKFKIEAESYLQDIKNITAKLGVSSNRICHDKGKGSDPLATSLATISAHNDVNQYSDELKKARDEDIPKLFDLMRDSNASMAQWMSAETLPLQSVMNTMSDLTEQITDKVFNVSLYAGLIEELVQCSDGNPANYSDKLHVMQRKLYMDEECLLDYKAGGLDFNSIGDFDKWLSKPENIKRILPFDRCIVAMQVRRKRKSREDYGCISKALVNLDIENADNLTFLYIRNGERLYWLQTELDFDDLIFPDKSTFDPSAPLMMKHEYSKFTFMSCNEYDSSVISFHDKKIKRNAWALENPNESGWNNPFRGSSSDFDPKSWTHFNQDSVYYDDATKQLMDIMKKYNRISLIIQGLLDRSDSLHPHPPIKTWQPESFVSGIKLVYDGSMMLYDGDAPDIESYISKCNESINSDSVLYGQYDFWTKKEAEKECRRLDNDWRNKSDWRPTTFTPLGNPGPDGISVANNIMSRAKKATFTWLRDRANCGFYDDSQIKTNITVPFSELFNISAYKLGDFKKFFSDPRTRKDYLKWAPVLLAAEEYWLLRKINESN